MGYVIQINAYADWERTYFVQGYDETEAVRKAYDMFRGTMSCVLPDTLEEALKSNGIWIDIRACVDQIIL